MKALDLHTLRVARRVVQAQMVHGICAGIREETTRDGLRLAYEDLTDKIVVCELREIRRKRNKK